jgi:hypothetical protein
LSLVAGNWQRFRVALGDGIKKTPVIMCAVNGVAKRTFV